MIKTYFDGACGPVNPGGTCGFGVVVYQNGKEIWRHSDIYYPKTETKTTNNLAEYAGLCAVLEYLVERNFTQEEIHICGDSQLVIQQMKGNFRIKKGPYVALANKCTEMLKRFSKISFNWIPKDENKIADGLSKVAIENVGENNQ